MSDTILDIAEAIGSHPGFEPPSPLWRATLAFFYGLPLSDTDVQSLTRATSRSAEAIRARVPAPMRELWCRIGRRGWKSSVAAIIALYEAAYGQHERFLIPGERGLVAVVSKDVAGSTAVARLVELYAAALGLATKWTSMGSVRILEIKGFSFAVACFPCSATAPRGYAIPVVIADEIAHWQTDADEYTNSDSAVLAAIKPAMAQFPDSRLVAISSPLGHEGVFHDTVEANLGDDAAPDVLAVEGPTWEWNLGITEARTRALEPDEDIHSREFGARPSQNEGTAFPRDGVASCFETKAGLYHWGQPFLVIDPAESVNTFAWWVAMWGKPARGRRQNRIIRHENGAEMIARDDQGRVIFEPEATHDVLHVTQLGGWTGDQLRQIADMEVIARELAGIARAAGADTVLSDRRADVYLAALLARHQLKLRSFTQTAQSKHEAVVLIRLLMRNKQIAIADHPLARRDLETYPRRIVGGGFRYGERRSGQKHHWDYASLLVTLAHSLLDLGDAPHERHANIENVPTRAHRGGRLTVSR